MADSRIQPNFKAFAALQREPAKDSLDPNPKAEDGSEQPPNNDAGTDNEIPSISLYQDPRDELDQQRHAMLAEARQAKGL
jgi:hypothetical protein